MSAPSTPQPRAQNASEYRLFVQYATFILVSILRMPCQFLQRSHVLRVRASLGQESVPQSMQARVRAKAARVQDDSVLIGKGADRQRQRVVVQVTEQMFALRFREQFHEHGYHIGADRDLSSPCFAL